MTRTLVLLVVTAQLADLALFGLAVRAQGIDGEFGPLAGVYVAGGFGAVALVKLAGVALVLATLALLHWRQRPDWRVTPRGVALLVAGWGVFGAATGLGAIG